MLLIDGGDLLRNSSSHAAHAGEQGDSGGPLIWSTAGYGLLVDSDGGYPYTDSINRSNGVLLWWNPS